MKRFERIGIGKHWTEPTITRFKKWAEKNPREFPPEALGDNLYSHAFYLFLVAAAYYLADEIEAAKLWAERLVAVSDEYFFGDWRRTMPNNPERPQDDVRHYWAKGGGNWMTTYHTSVPYAIALDDWDTAKRLSAHPSEDKKDCGMWQQERPWYLLLAEYFVHGTSTQYESRLAAIRSGSAKGPKVFAECLDAIAKKRTKELDERFAEQMKYYLRNQKKRDEMEFKLALDGTILYHLARRDGHEIVMDDFSRDHLIIF